jgi:tetratricopeptide (TPR) repeat protein
MPEESDQALTAALERLIAGQPAGEDLLLLRQAVAEGRISLESGDRSVAVGGSLTGSTVLAGTSQSGGVNFGQSNQIHISGSVIGTMTLNLPNAAEAARLLESLQPYRPDAPPPADSLPEPGALPPGARLPFSRNAVFTGREADLIALASSLLHSGQHSVLSGTGGVGKTQLAVEFCYRYARFFHGLHWLHADQDMQAEISACGLAMGLSPWPETLPEQAQATLQAWRRGGPRLVVLDNVDDAALLQEWLPQLPQARVLVTSRLRDWPPDLGLGLHSLDSLPRAHSLALLRKLAPRLASAAERDLDAVAERLGDLPLALDLAGRYLGDRRALSVGDFLDELEKAGSALAHSSLRDWTEHNPTRHATDLAATFLLSWDKLQRSAKPEASRSQGLFCAAGYCAANTPIPWEVFYRLSEAEDGQAQAAVDKSLGQLEDTGLLSLADAGPVIHPLLAEFARLQDRTAEQSPLPKLADGLAEAASAASQTGAVAGMLPLLPHLRQVLGYAAWLEREKMALLASWLGRLYQDTGNYPAARPCYEQALAINRKVLGEVHPDTALSLNNLGLLLKAQGDYAGALPYLEQSLAINLEALGEKHPATARSLNNLGALLESMGDSAGARRCYEQALAIRRQVLGEKHPDTAHSLNNLGLLLQAQGDSAGALPYLEQSLAISREVLGEVHPDTANSLNSLGLLLQAQGDYAGARPCYEQALAIRREVLGEKHPDTATSLNNLGGLLQAQGDYAGARPYYEQALAINREALGEKHPATALSLNNLGLLLQAQGDSAGALPYLEQALAIRREVLGEQHSDTAGSLNNLGFLLHSMGDYAGARLYYEQALAIYREVLGENHPATAQSLNNLGALLHAQGDYAGARPYFEQALAIRREALGEKHPDTALSLNNLGFLLYSMGDYAGAQPFFEQTLAILEQLLPPDHSTLRTVRANLESVISEIQKRRSGS